MHLPTTSQVKLSIEALMDLACTYALNHKDSMASECATLAHEQAVTAGLVQEAYDVNEFLAALGDHANRRYVK